MIHPVDYAPSQDFGANPTKHLPASHWIIQQFGNYQPDGHTGVDYPCPTGTPVKAAADGVVLHVGYMAGTWATNPWWIAPGFAGFVYVVDHGHFIGIYGHCKDGGALVRNGQRVTEGQTLGLSGNTGASTGPHLHFEVLPDGYVLNSPMYGRINPASLFGKITAQSTGTTTKTQEDELSAEFEADARGEFDALRGFQNDVRGAIAEINRETDGLEAFIVDVRGDLANKGAQLSAQAAAIQSLTELLGKAQGLDVEQVRAAVAAAIADGITLTVKAGGQA